MISLPEHVLVSDPDRALHAWDGRDHETNHPNKETGMDWAEHQRIVCEARHLVQGEAPYGGDVKKIFAQLKSSYTDANSRTTVKVSRCIHQPGVDPHLQLRVLTTFKRPDGSMESIHKFHLNVSVVRVSSDIRTRARHWVRAGMAGNRSAGVGSVQICSARE